MSEAKPTLGKLIINDEHEWDSEGYRFWRADIGGPDRVSVCQIQSSEHCEDYGWSREETKTVARLFVAAPDLLAELKALIEICQTYGVGEDRLPAAIAALNKAEGKP